MYKGIYNYFIQNFNTENSLMKFINLAFMAALLLSGNTDLFTEARPASPSTTTRVTRTTSYRPGSTTVVRSPGISMGYSSYRPVVIGGSPTPIIHRTSYISPTPMIVSPGYVAPHYYTSSGSRLGGGAWAGIVIGILAFFALIWCLAVFSNNSVYDDTVIYHEPGVTTETTTIETINNPPQYAPIGPPPQFPPGQGPSIYCNKGHIMEHIAFSKYAEGADCDNCNLRIPTDHPYYHCSLCEDDLCNTCG